ncbi:MULTISPECIES: methionine ABC transporter permease [unclassified Motilimonas]|uniref:methionine ABC transporter permease n=1 Tax=Motilimonas TaxID=1914248 RepID=UPI001E5A836B|nr:MULTISPECIES: methionine ABC transporter permease [unclassified Motilimonas]MCE0557652.1 ABC transporter permease [Motilimonas sp. E26]MDO6526330.1 methionine ABC transporter permease [Motilimonas sp. 1_MG-2023]
MSEAMIALLTQAFGETLMMVGLSGLISCVFGIPLGVLLHNTKAGELWANPTLNHILGISVNIGRSVPFIILLVAIIPLTRIIVGSSIGTLAATVPLTIAAIPFVARLIEGALMEVPSGLVEAANAMGATPLQIICKVCLPEALPGIINSITITLVTLVNYSAMAGAVGGGGLGDVGIRYGFHRFEPQILIITVIVLIALVQVIQMLGDYLVNKVDHR